LTLRPVGRWVYAAMGPARRAWLRRRRRRDRAQAAWLWRGRSRGASVGRDL